MTRPSGWQRAAMWVAVCGGGWAVLVGIVLTNLALWAALWAALVALGVVR